MTQLHLSAVEGDALRIAELLVGHGRAPALPPRIDVAAPSDALLEAVARTVAAGAVQFLLRSGGGRERTVLRDGKRKSGRLWDASLNDSFDLRFTRATRSFWHATVRDLVPLAHSKRAGGELGREERRVVRSLAPEGSDGVGDLVFFALAHQHAASLHLGPALEEALRHELRRAAPLALLFAPDDAAFDDDTVRASLRALMAPGALRVLECVDDALLEAWLSRFRQVLLHTRVRQRFLAGMRAFARTLRVWLELLDAHGRLDLSRSVVRFLACLPKRAFPAGLDVRNHALRLPGTSGMADRDEALRAMLGVVDLRLFVDDARARLGRERYGDERYAEAQVVVPMIEAELASTRADVEGLARVLSGAVG